MRDWRPRAREFSPAPLGMPALVWQILAGRGIQEADAVRSHLQPSLKNLRHPATMLGMDQAVKRLLRAREQEQTVAIYADFDLDGSSGLALLKRGLEALGFKNLLAYQPRRLAEGYGVHRGAVDELVALGAKVMVTVDVGITAHDAIGYAQEQGLEVIVTDHHLPGPTLPKAHVIVNPNQPGCSSGLTHLSGAGVAYYLVLALRAQLRESGEDFPDFDPKELLDCFAIGTITDMVPLVAENRVLIKHGLLQLAATKLPGLRALLRRLDLEGRSLSAQDVGLRIAPKLNALSRLETGLRPIDLLLEKDSTRAEQIAEEVLALNAQRLQIQRAGEALAKEQAEAWREFPLVWVFSEEFHRGVIGLIASRLAEEFGKPAFVGAVGLDGRIVGSSRLPPGSQEHLVHALTSAKDILTRFGGHRQAAGFEVESTRAEELGAKLKQYFSHSQLPSGRGEPLLFDAEGEMEEVNPSLMDWLERIGPFGQQFPSPILRVEGARLAQVKELKGGHLRLSLKSQRSSHELEAIWFSPDPWFTMSSQGADGRAVELLAEPEWNFFKGRRRLQLQIRDLRFVPEES